MLANNNMSTSAQVIPTCEYWKNWNAYLCTDDNIGVMLFDSEDPDRMDRSVQPVYVQHFDSGFDNKLNSFMDHCWDGFYTCQKRESRFPTVVYQVWDEYNLEYTGTPPNKQSFRLYGKPGSKGFLVTIKYPNAGAYQILDSNKEAIMHTDWDHEAKTWAKPKGRFCGEFRYEGVINRLQFWLERGCVLYVRPRDAIMLAIRMEFTMSEFYGKGGVTTFTDRMAAVLGIHRADLKVVTVYEGSTIVEFQVMSDPEAEEEEDIVDLSDVTSKFEEFV